MDALQESYLGGIIVGVMIVLILQMSWRLIKEIIDEAGSSETGQTYSTTLEDKKSA